MEDWDIEADEQYDCAADSREPFFAYSEGPCEDCGRPIEACRCNEEHPTCPALYILLLDCDLVSEICAVIRAHRQICPVCATPKKPLKLELAEKREKKEAA